MTHTLKFKDREALSRALANSLLFMSKDILLPSITQARFEYKSNAVKVASMDRFRLCVETVETLPVDGDIEPFTFKLQRYAIHAALNMVKSAGRIEPVELIVDLDAATLTVKIIDTSATWPLDTDNGFPQIHSLIPSIHDGKPTETIGFKPAFLADLAKVKVDGKLEGVSIRLYGEGKPTRIDYNDDLMVLLMSFRVNR